MAAIAGPDHTNIGAEICPLARDRLSPGEQAPLTATGVTNQVRTCAVTGNHEDGAGRGKLMHRADTRVSLILTAHGRMCRHGPHFNARSGRRSPTLMPEPTQGGYPAAGRAA